MRRTSPPTLPVSLLPSNSPTGGGCLFEPAPPHVLRNGNHGHRSSIVALSGAARNRSLSKYQLSGLYGAGGLHRKINSRICSTGFCRACLRWAATPIPAVVPPHEQCARM